MNNLPAETWMDSSHVLPPDNLRVICSDGKDWWVDWLNDGIWKGSGRRRSDRCFWKIPALPNPGIVDAVFGGCSNGN